jgi:hypothetical protein
MDRVVIAVSIMLDKGVGGLPVDPKAFADGGWVIVNPANKWGAISRARLGTGWCSAIDLTALRALAAARQARYNLLGRNVEVKCYRQIPAILAQPVIKKSGLENSPRIPVQKEPMGAIGIAEPLSDDVVHEAVVD